MTDPKIQRTTKQRAPFLLPYALVFYTGAAILILEIVGTRLISPFYGTSLYVWSSVITVTLLSLALGYELGGRLADRLSPSRTLRYLLAGTGLIICLLPVIRQRVLDLTSVLGLQAGAFASAAIFFMLPLILLSSSGILVIKMVTPSLEKLGQGVGKTYFYSTMGSVFGSVLVSFVLIPHFAVSRILYGIALGLFFCVALLYFNERKMKAFGGVLLCAVLAANFLWAADDLPESNLIYSNESFYGQVKVAETRSLRLLFLDGMIQSIWNFRENENGSDYINGFEYMMTDPGPEKKALLLGLGAGMLPTIFEDVYGVKTDSVEINPLVVEVAREFFGFTSRGETYTEDGRTFVNRTSPAQYDLVVLDTFSGESIPFHLITREFFGEVRKILTPRGIFGINYVGAASDRYSKPWRSIGLTLQSEFQFVKVFALNPVSGQEDEPQNFLFFASDRPLPSVNNVPKTREKPRRIVSRMMRQEVPLVPHEGSVRLSDDYNPIDIYHSRAAQGWRKNAIKKTRSVLLY